jgi:hypothetical protein
MSPFSVLFSVSLSLKKKIWRQCVPHKKKKKAAVFCFPCYARIEDTIERDGEIKDLPHYRSGADDGGKKGGRRDLCL